MNNIKLTAKLKAYSKAPFFPDYVRGVNVLADGTTQELEPNTLYARKDGNWEKVFFGDLQGIGDRLEGLERSDTQLALNDQDIQKQLKNIYVNFDTINDILIYKDIDGNEHSWYIESRVDNSTIKYSADGKLELMYKPDGVSLVNQITEDGKLMQKAKALYYERQVMDLDGGVIKDSGYLSGSDILLKFEQNRTTMDHISSVLSGLQTDVNSTLLGVVNLFDIYTSNVENKEQLIDDRLTAFAIDALGILPELLGGDLFVYDSYSGNIFKSYKDSAISNVYWEVDSNKSTYIPYANNSGLAGLVVGSEWDQDGEYDESWESLPNYLKGNINSKVDYDDEDKNKFNRQLPTISINGLKERLQDLDDSKLELSQNSSIYDSIVAIGKNSRQQIGIKVSQSPISNSSPIRDVSGNIQVGYANNDNDATSLLYIKSLFMQIGNIIGDGVVATYDDSYSSQNNRDDITTSVGFVDDLSL